MSAVHELKNRRELFLDDFITESVSGDMRKVLHEPVPHDPDPTAPRGAYQTVLYVQGKLYRYYQGKFSDYTRLDRPEPFDVKPGFIGEFTGFAESRDGHRWMKPDARIYDSGVPNVVFCNSPRYLTHNLTPFLDVNPACAKEARFKALAGTTDSGGMFALFSPDGVSWTVQGDEPVYKSPGPRFSYLFDSQNVSFYSEAEGRYVCYFRVNRTKDDRPLRSIARIDSEDYLHWENFQELDVNLPDEHLYVSQLQPYFRAPQFYIGTPTRYFEERGSATDIGFLFSREGGPIRRTWREAWIRPGFDKASWSNRYNYLACGIVPTSPNEISLFHNWNGVRYSLRYDGFVSYSSFYEGGEWLSRVLRYTSGELELNAATSTGGILQVELQTPEGGPLPGFSFEESEKMYGNSVSWRPRWKSGRTLEPGTVLRIAVRSREAEFYSFSFTEEKEEEDRGTVLILSGGDKKTVKS